MGKPEEPGQDRRWFQWPREEMLFSWAIAAAAGTQRNGFRTYVSGRAEIEMWDIRERRNQGRKLFISPHPPPSHAAE